MEQFRQIGEVWGSVKALMVLKDDIRINQRQCCLLLDIFRLAYKTIAEEIKNNLRLEEKNTKWRALEQPLKELHRIFKEGELYIRTCLDYKDWWGKAISLHQNKDCVEFHIHNLLSCFHVVIEALESAEEISGLDQDDMQKRRFMLERKYEKEWSDPKLFLWKLGKQYLISREICSRLETAWREDRWLLLEAITEKKTPLGHSPRKYEKSLCDFLYKKITGSDPLVKLFPSSILLGAKDYQVKRRIGGENQLKEIQWLGESFALRHFWGDIEPLTNEIVSLLSLAHPNIMQFLCGFSNEEKNECYLVMELMSKDLSTHIKEHCSSKRRIPFTLPVVIDLMLQIARGMEYLHSKKIYHGGLNPSNVLLKARHSSPDGYFYAKVSGFGLSSIKNNNLHKNIQNQSEASLFIWHAPEVIAEKNQAAKYSEKADVYSYGMLCFELLTGKVPFEDGHLQGEKMGRNIIAGERPLFPVPSPKFLANLTKKCWQSDPHQRPSFSSICRILRYMQKFIVMNPGHNQLLLPSPPVDYCDIEAGFIKKGSSGVKSELPPVSQIPFQMFAYKLLEKEKISACFKEKSWDSKSEFATICGDPIIRSASVCEDPIIRAASVCGDPTTIKAASVCGDPTIFKAASVCGNPINTAALVCGDDNRSGANGSFVPASDLRSVCSEIPAKKLSTIKKVADEKGRKSSGTPKANIPKILPWSPCRSSRTSPRKLAPMITPPIRRSRSSHAPMSKIS